MTEERHDNVIQGNFLRRGNQLFPTLNVPDALVKRTALAYAKEATPLGHLVSDWLFVNLFPVETGALAHYLLATVFPWPYHPVDDSVRLAITNRIGDRGFCWVAAEELVYWIKMPREKKQLLGSIHPDRLLKSCFTQEYNDCMTLGMWDVMLCCLAACRMEAEHKLR